MPFRRIHKIITYLMAVQGLGLLVLSGELTLVGSIAAAVLLVASWFAEGERIATKRYTNFWNAITVAVFIVQFVRWMAGEGLPIVAVQFAAFLQVNKLFNRRRQGDYDQIAILSLMHLIVSAILYTEMSYALVFIMYTIVTPWMLVLGQIRREVEAKYWDRENRRSLKDLERVLRSRRIISGRFLFSTALLSIPIYLMTALLFLFFPRIGFGLLAASDPSQRQLTGFSDQVIIGDLAPLFDDPTVVMRVEFPEGPLPEEKLSSLYWRGSAYDSFDGIQWHRTLGHGSLLESWGRYYVLTPEHERTGSDPQRILSGMRQFDVFLQPLYPKVVFVPQETAFLAVPAPSELRVMGQKLRWGPSNEVRYSDPGATGIHYVVYLDESALVSATMRPFEGRLAPSARTLEPYLQHPPLSQRFEELADGFERDHPDPLHRARAIETWLRTNLGYTTTASREVPETMAPVDAFLFEWREGNCEYFSTAMVILLRASHVPARNITGFIGGAWNDVGDYLAVREADAHSWVEVHVDGQGWILFDPTPPSEALPGDDGSILAFLSEFVDTIRLSWHKRIIAYDLTQQADLLRRGYRSISAMRGAMQTMGKMMPEGLFRQVRFLGPLVVLALIVIAYLAFRRRRAEPALPQSRIQRRAHRKALDLIGLVDRRLEEQGLKRPPSRPPLTHAQLVSEQLMDPTPLSDVVDVYNSTRFGGRPLTSEMFASLRRRISTIRRQNLPHSQ
jgi:hypothetical protein